MAKGKFLLIAPESVGVAEQTKVLYNTYLLVLLHMFSVTLFKFNDQKNLPVPLNEWMIFATRSEEEKNAYPA